MRSSPTARATLTDAVLAYNGRAESGYARRVPQPKPLNVWDYERLAEEKLPAGAFGYFAGGAGDERTLRDNVEAYGRYRLRPRVLVDVTEVTTRTTVLGTDVSMPLLVAPTALQRMAHPDGELATARAAAAAGTIMCLSTIATATAREVADAAPDAPRWFQLYVLRDEARTRALLEEAAETGYSAVVLTADTPYLGRRERDVRNAFSIPAELVVPNMPAPEVGSLHRQFESMSAGVTWRDVERISSMAGLPVLVKGILTAEDALLAVEHGAAGIVVSNHGGRQLDGVPATLDALPEVVDAVGGRVEVLLDGGIRRGTDVLKALALGAGVAMAGRAVLWGLAVDGEAGVSRVLELLRAEIELGLALLGCHSPDEVGSAHVARTSA
jgi:isopentenyl diphosphate isomerase/L-lactate dehydrogenase-like FMN-dependent dehydrogenase